MDHIHRLYSYFNKEYLKRAYVIGCMFFLLMSLALVFGAINANDGIFNKISHLIFMFVYMAIITLLFPFSKMLWDNTKTFILGNTILITSVFFLFPAKFIVNGLLWSMSLFLGPVGIAYAWYKTK